VRQPDGATLRQHLEAAAAQGMRHALLDGPPCPVELQHVWHWFCELDRQRGSNGFGVNPLAFTEIAAWADLTSRSPRPFEMDLLLKLDADAMKHYAEQVKNG